VKYKNDNNINNSIVEAIKVLHTKIKNSHINYGKLERRTFDNRTALSPFFDSTKTTIK
jgi:hypothetical protein